MTEDGLERERVMKIRALSLAISPYTFSYHSPSYQLHNTPNIHPAPYHTTISHDTPDISHHLLLLFLDLSLLDMFLQASLIRIAMESLNVYFSFLFSFLDISLLDSMIPRH